MTTASRTILRRTAAMLALLVTLFGLTACGGGRAHLDTSAGAPADTLASPPLSADATATPTTSATTVARLNHSTTVHEQASATAPAVTTLAPTTKLGSATTLDVLEQHDGWLHVALPIRPNGSTGWIESKGVELRTIDDRIDVDLAARTLTVRRGDVVVVQTPIATGATATPTPVGNFFITDIIDTESAGGAYGPFAFGLSGHSETLTEFAGGDGQIGLHGTNDPSSIGQSVSHGCVRVPNEVISALASALALGTPVSIH